MFQSYMNEKKKPSNRNLLDEQTALIETLEKKNRIS
jgi:hypothetical protein